MESKERGGKFEGLWEKTSRGELNASDRDTTGSGNIMNFSLTIGGEDCSGKGRDSVFEGGWGEAQENLNNRLGKGGMISESAVEKSCVRNRGEEKIKKKKGGWKGRKI